MPRLPLPKVLADVFDDRQARTTLLAGVFALFAAGLDPKVWGPSLSTVQAAIRERPSLEAYVLLGVVASAILLLVGGAIGDLRRARPLIVGGLATLVVTGTVGLLIPEGPVFIAARLIGAAASALTVPAALASVALAYRGVARATALGIAYAIYAGALAVMPMLLTFLPAPSGRGSSSRRSWPLVALFVVRGRIPDLERPGRLERPYVLGTALWASAVVAISVGVLWLGSGWEHPLRWAIIGFGVALLVAYSACWERRRRVTHPADLQVDRRPVTVALFAGVVIALAQSAPMLILPQYFAIVRPLRPDVRVARHRAADRRADRRRARSPGYLLVALPAAGARRRGAGHRGLGNLGVALIAGPATGYVLFVLPLLLIGAGFVVGDDRADGDHLRERPAGPAGDRGRAQRGVAGGRQPDRHRDRDGDRGGGRAEHVRRRRPGRWRRSRPPRRDSSFADVLYAVGTPSFPALARAIQPDRRRSPTSTPTSPASGRPCSWAALAAVLGGVVAWLGLGRRDPLATRGADPMASVYEHRDERVAVEP